MLSSLEYQEEINVIAAALIRWGGGVVRIARITDTIADPRPGNYVVKKESIQSFFVKPLYMNADIRAR